MCTQRQHHTSLHPVQWAPSPVSQSRLHPPCAGPVLQASTARRRVSRLPVGGAQLVRGEKRCKVGKEKASMSPGGNSLGQSPSAFWQQKTLPGPRVPGRGRGHLSSVILILPGYYCDSSTGPVQNFSLYPCPRGYYCPVGTTKAMHHSCPVGTYGPQKGLTSITECQLCPAGKFCSLAGISAPTGTEQGF